MARKSRRVKVEQRSVLPAKQAMNAAAYARISVDRGDEETRETIENQVELVCQFIEGHEELQLENIYADCGWSGTEFERPEFLRMMEGVRTGKIQCIVVKDLSRFGRSYLETGYYLETLLPLLNVRFISINDGLDTAREGDLDSIVMPVKNIVNELYARELSRKQTIYFELHSRRGDAGRYRSTYGYSIDRETGKLIPDSRTAPCVQIIFRWFLMGCGAKEIADRLNALEIMTPSGCKAAGQYTQVRPGGDCWRADRVRTILRNRTYAGDTVYGKRRKMLWRDIPSHHARPEEWIIHQNTHEPLVLRSDFEKVQEKMDARGALMRKGKAVMEGCRGQYPDSFPRKVICMECGHTMGYHRYSHSAARDECQGAYYLCGGNDMVSGCRQKVHEDYLRMAAAGNLRKWILALCGRKEILRKIKGGSYNKGALARVRQRERELASQLEKVQKAGIVLYENLAADRIRERDFCSQKQQYVQRRRELESELRNAEGERRALEKTLERLQQMAEHLEEYCGERKFNQTLADELIARIRVSSTGAVEIEMKYGDIMKEIEKICGEGEDL